MELTVRIDSLHLDLIGLVAFGILLGIALLPGSREQAVKAEPVIRQAQWDEKSAEAASAEKKKTKAEELKVIQEQRVELLDQIQNKVQQLEELVGEQPASASRKGGQVR